MTSDRNAGNKFMKIVVIRFICLYKYMIPIYFNDAISLIFPMLKKKLP